MALNWLWKNKMGTMEYGDKGTNTLYAGNCLGIEIWEDGESDSYQVVGFWNDEEHLKRMLGLSKDGMGYNVYQAQGLTKVRLNTFFAKDVKKITKHLSATAATDHWNLVVEFYYEEIRKEDE